MSLEIWKVLFLIANAFLLWPIVKHVSIKKQWTSMNYEKRKIPYTAGVFLVTYSTLFAITWKVPKLSSFLIYVFLLWLAGWIDDLYGSDEPKGIRGHLSHSLKNGVWTTGLLKIGFITTAAVLVFTVESWEWTSSFVTVAILCLVLSPHVCNLLDTRPLRVWKWTLLHFIVIGITNPQLLDVQYVLSLIIFFGVWGWVEAKKRGMLGDNGAAVAGGLTAWLTLNTAPVYIQVAATTIYLLITITSEKFSLYELTLKIKDWKLWAFKTKNEGDI